MGVGFMGRENHSPLNPQSVAQNSLLRCFHRATTFLLLTLAGATAAPVDTFNVAWDSPSANHHGSMPLGNGDIALNAWMTADGDLHFYISKTDAWDGMVSNNVCRI